MDLWGLPEETSGASQPAFDIYPHGAAQPVGGYGIFNFGMPDSILDSDRRWKRQHVFRVPDVLSRLGHAAGNDFVFCSEVGDTRKGFRAANVDFQHVVQDALAGVACSSSGADVHWQALDLTYRAPPPLADRDASQLAALPVWGYIH